MFSHFYVWRTIDVCMLSTGNCWAVTWCDLYFKSSHMLCIRNCTGQMPLLVILGLTAIAQFIVFWQAQNKATPQHAEILHSNLLILDVTDNHRKSVWTFTQPPPLSSVPSSSATRCSAHCCYAIPWPCPPTGLSWAVKNSPWHGHNMFLNWPLHEDEWVSSLPCQ